MSALLLYTGSAVILVWGVGHLIPTRGVVSGFGNLSPDNARIITMEWVAEGLTLCFLGLLVALVAALVGPDHQAAHLVARICAGMLAAVAILSAFTGARTSVLPMRLCPVVKFTVAVVYVAATLA